MARNQFTFYRSFWEALQALPKRDQLSFVTAVCAYALDGEERPLSGAAKASFLLVKPVLETAGRRAASGKLGGSREKAKGKQTAREIETENENETENEIEVETETEAETEKEGEGPSGLPAAAPAAAVLRAYQERLGSGLSEKGREELAGFAGAMGLEVCLRAMDAAVDNQAPRWPYVRKILETKQAQGVRSLADWDALEQRRTAREQRRTSSWAELAREIEQEPDPSDWAAWSV